MSYVHQLEKKIDNPSEFHMVVSCGYFIAWHEVQHVPPNIRFTPLRSTWFENGLFDF